MGASELVAEPLEEALHFQSLLHIIVFIENFCKILAKSANKSTDFTIF